VHILVRHWTFYNKSNCQAAVQYVGILLINFDAAVPINALPLPAAEIPSFL